MKHKKIFLLAGTTEGRKIAEWLDRYRAQAIVSVATEYGEELIASSRGLYVMHGRLTQEEMVKVIEKEGVEVVIDATHPYAVVVSENMRSACEKTQIEYLRLIRPEGKKEGVHTFKTLGDGIEYLRGTTGGVLLTTGSKDLADYTKLENYKERLYPRILPMVEALEAAFGLGYKRSHMICMQGPFSYELNVAMLKAFNVKYMVTKDSGDVGGLINKLEAAKAVGVEVILIERPKLEKGYTLEEILERISLYLL